MIRFLVLSFVPLAMACAPGSSEAVGGPASESVDRSAVSPSQTTTQDSPPSNGDARSAQGLADADDACGTARVKDYIGKEATVPVRTAVSRISGAGSDRWIYPDSVVTEDFSPTRLNVVMDKATDMIVSMRCG